VIKWTNLFYFPAMPSCLTYGHSSIRACMKNCTTRILLDTFDILTDQICT